MTQYKVKSPSTGYWLAAPNEGMVDTAADAYCYAETDPHLVDVVDYGRRRGVKLVLREVPVARPKRILCPECRGSGDSREYPFYPCERCEGRGTISA